MHDVLQDSINRYKLVPQELISYRVGSNRIYIYKQEDSGRIYCLVLDANRLEDMTISNVGVRSFLVGDEWIIYGRLLDNDAINVTPQTDAPIIIKDDVFFFVSEHDHVELAFENRNEMPRKMSFHRP